MLKSNQQIANSFRNVASSIAVMHGPLGGIASRFSSTATIFSRTGLALGAVSIGAAGVTFAFGRMLGVAREAIAEFDKLGKAARTAGLSSDLYQSLGFAALEEGVDGLGGALEQFTVRSGQLATGQGELYTYFSKTNEALLHQLELSTSQEERLRIVADAVRDATSAEEKATIARAAFGRSGVEMVRILKDGADGLDDFTRRAREMGIVIDREIIARAEEMNNKLGVAQHVIDNQLKQAFIDLAPVVIAAAEAIAWVARAIRDVADAAKLMGGNLDLVPTDRLENEALRLEYQYRDLEIALVDMAKAGRDMELGGAIDSAVEMHQAQVDVIRRQMEANREAVAEIEAILSGRRTPTQITVNADPPKLYDGGSKKTSPFTSAMESIADRIEILKAETEAQRQLNPLVNDYGYALEHARAKQQLLNAAKKEGLAITPELSAAIDEMAHNLAAATVEAARLTEEQDNLKKSWEEWRDLARESMRGFIDDLVEGKSATEALGGALQKLGDHLINLGLNSIFGSGGNDFGLFGKAFGFSGGGYTGAGGKHQPAGVVHKGEYVFSKQATQRAGVGNLEAMHQSLKGYASGGPVGVSLPRMPSPANDNAPAITYAPQIDARGADIAAVARLEQVIANDRAQFESRVQAIARGRGRKWK